MITEGPLFIGRLLDLLAAGDSIREAIQSN